MKTLLLTAAAMVALASIASAHPGHGATSAGLWLHYVIEPAHVLVTCLIFVVAAVVIRMLRARHASRSKAT
ncbi:MAG: hypothetical protein O3A51_02195 [Verrucomicrobia bacterium]|nr:hypothetical protein [Verrucomicrobiota bacterium]